MNPRVFETFYPWLWLWAQILGRWLVLREPRHIRRVVMAGIRQMQAQGRTVTLDRVRAEIYVVKLWFERRAKQPTVTAEQHSPEA